MAKLFLLDAYALIYRSYYAFIKSPRINSKGLNTSAIMGFCNTLHEVLTKEHPEYIAVAFDHGKTFRHEAFPAYKAQREATPEDIKLSVPIIKNILEAYHIPILQVDGYEADDIIGTVATKAGAEGIETYMLTPDKDYGQLVKPNVYMYRPRHGGGYDKIGESEIEEKYSITSPSQVIDLLALMGDSADNFPGCPGVGEKTAAKLINEFGSVDNLLANTDKLKGKMKEKVEAAVDDIKMSYFLATIKTDVPMGDLTLDELKVEQPDTEKLDKIFTELEFKTLKNKFLNKTSEKKKNVNSEPDLFSAFANKGTEEPENANFESLKTIAHNYQLVENEEEAKKLCDYLLTNKIVSLDTETTSTHPIDAELVGLSFSVKENEAFYVAVPADFKKALTIVNIFKKVYENTEILKVGQNIKYDMEVLHNYGINVQGPMFDTMIAHYLIDPELQHNMDYMAETILHYRTIHIEELIGPKGRNQKNMRDLDPKDVYEYAAEDADITLKLKNALEPRLKDVNAEKLFWDMEMPLVPVLADMETTGVCLDTDSLKETSTLFTKRMKALEKEIFEEAGEEFNISSPKQVGEILFGKMKLVDKPKKTRTGQYVTSEEVLQQLRSKAKIVANILDYRGLKKLLGTYVDALPKLINPRTGHIHTSFNQTITATGRLSSSDPNLQNIPVRDDDGKEIRKCFIPEPGCLFFSADYSQIELRIMAHLSGDENMIEAFREGFDIHRATAAKIWHEDMDEVTDAQRKKAKQANFGIIYGITTYGLAQRMDIPNGEARQLIDDYFTTFPKVHAYMEKAKEEAREKGYAETLFGRRRYLPDINSKNGTVRGFAERNAINAPIQGSEADIIKVAMIRIWRRFKEEGIRSKMILQVHDELNFSVFPEEKEKVEKIVIEEMQGAYHLDVPLIADAGWGKNWLEAH
ncbi:DNA polymerase I [Prevotella lacticifex]|uniref:DNA polymerase I n=1 Tax=Prevotella lacticifex TaxID=2854755 RepID=A0A9R1CC57_9BACT|nr:DNA polymerase I [Prevotella lacticifex]GJG36417.1 DNA polymerase I [Prevotella lacticifex]GJG38276.1 DNA polymerase I [Prevotella lacticifex]GJG43041.1 DNA polymerase I [Prevotella lacticifex]GJG44633.1 DNA polymerase I [Prevotella lacticifex]GJG49392.1 DNA polymerase I [Prevotella lacticifex]